jgi:hypothetical protein
MVSAKLTYAEMDTELRARSKEDLLSLMDSPSIKVGDTASGLLSGRKAFDTIYHAVCQSKFRTALGRKRALNVLIHAGPRYRKGLDACVRLLRDRSKLVVDEALFGLCHWNEQSTLAALDTVTCRAADEDVELARRAIKARDIRIFSRYYSIDEKWREYQRVAA